MSTRETQNRIVDAAIELFNASGVSSVSTSKIASLAGVSSGNLHYHYANKGEVVFDIWSRMEGEIRRWGHDELEPTIQHVATMNLRKYRHLWKYRFFYRELNILLELDPELKYRFLKVRHLRMEGVFQYFQAMIDNGVVRKDLSELELRDLIRISWIVSESWLSFVSVEDEKIDMSTMQEGYRMVLQVFIPILTAQAMEEIPESFTVFSLTD